MPESASPVTPYSGRLEVPGTLVADYILRAPESPQELYVLLHGYSQTARAIFDRLASRLPAQSVVFAPNGPYPVPERVEGKYRVGYSWYFYDSAADEYLIDQRNSISLIAEGVKKLGFGSLPARVIGFSQGAYLASLLGMALPQLRQVVSVAGRFLDDEVQGIPSFRFDSVHGEKDDTVDANLSRKSHERLLARGGRGVFLSDPGSGHRFTPGLVELVLKALEFE